MIKFIICAGPLTALETAHKQMLSNRIDIMIFMSSIIHMFRYKISIKRSVIAGSVKRRTECNCSDCW